jgi:hypothetical protein
MIRREGNGLADDPSYLYQKGRITASATASVALAMCAYGLADIPSKLTHAREPQSAADVAKLPNLLQ